MIEDALREAFAAEVTAAPDLNGIADRAIHRARAVRRRQSVAVGLAGVIVVAMVGGFTVNLWTDRATGDGFGRMIADGSRVPTDHPSDSVESPLPPTAKDVEVADNNEIYTAQKQRLQLPATSAGAVTSAAYRASDGYLVIKSQTTGNKLKQLVLVDEKNTQKVLLDEARSIAVSSTGDQIAWTKERGVIAVADRHDNPGLTKSTSIRTAEDAAPAGFVGKDVVIAREAGPGYDVWYSSRNAAYAESWDDRILRIFGDRVNGTGLYAEIAVEGEEKAMCLALLKPEQPFKVVSKRCGLPKAAKEGACVSPDGRWLAYPVAGENKVVMIDLLNEAFDQEVDPVRWWKDVKVVGRPVWLHPTAFIVDNGASFVSLSPNMPDKTNVVEGKRGDNVLIAPLRQ